MIYRDNNLQNIDFLVRKGGILSPFLFNIHVAYLCMQINKCSTGMVCTIHGLLVSHLMYADELVVIAPSEFPMLLQICKKFWTRDDVGSVQVNIL